MLLKKKVNNLYFIFKKFKIEIQHEIANGKPINCWKVSQIFNLYRFSFVNNIL